MEVRRKVNCGKNLDFGTPYKQPTIKHPAAIRQPDHPPECLLVCSLHYLLFGKFVKLVDIILEISKIIFKSDF